MTGNIMERKRCVQDNSIQVEDEQTKRPTYVREAFVVVLVTESSFQAPDTKKVSTRYHILSYPRTSNGNRCRGTKACS